MTVKVVQIIISFPKLRRSLTEKKKKNGHLLTNYSHSSVFWPNFGIFSRMIKVLVVKKIIRNSGVNFFLLNLRLKCCFEQFINCIFKRCQEHSVHLQQKLSVIGCLLSCKKCQMQVGHQPDCLVSETSCITTNNLSVLRRFLDWVVQGVSSQRQPLPDLPVWQENKLQVATRTNDTITGSVWEVLSWSHCCSRCLGA